MKKNVTFSLDEALMKKARNICRELPCSFSLSELAHLAIEKWIESYEKNGGYIVGPNDKLRPGRRITRDEQPGKI